MENKLTILIDLDGVTTNFVKQLKKFTAEYYNIDTSNMIIHESMEDDYYKTIYSQKGFFETLEPIEGSIDAIKVLNEKHNCFICTAPGGYNYAQCLMEKQIWIEKYLPKLAHKVFMTKHKYLVNGDFLIDDSSYNLDHFPKKTICFRGEQNKNIIFKKDPTYFVNNWQEILEILG